MLTNNHPEYIEVQGKKVKFQWCFEIGQVVEIDTTGWIPKCEDLPITSNLSSCYQIGSQWYRLKRIRDGLIWGEVCASS